MQQKTKKYLCTAYRLIRRRKLDAGSPAWQKIKHETGIGKCIVVSSLALCTTVCNPFVKKINRCLVFTDFVYAHFFVWPTCAHDTGKRCKTHEKQNATWLILLWPQYHSELPLEALVWNKKVVALFSYFFCLFYMYCWPQNNDKVSKSQNTHNIAYFFTQKHCKGQEIFSTWKYKQLPSAFEHI